MHTRRYSQGLVLDFVLSPSSDVGRRWGATIIQANTQNKVTASVVIVSFFLSLPLGKGETKGVESKEEKKKRRKEEGKKTTRRHPWTTQLFYALIDLSTCTVNSGLLNYRRDGS